MISFARLSPIWALLPLSVALSIYAWIALYAVGYREKFEEAQAELARARQDLEEQRALNDVLGKQLRARYDRDR